MHRVPPADGDALAPAEHVKLNKRIAVLENARGTKLWVVYVKNFAGITPQQWTRETMRANGLGDGDAILAIATDETAFSFRVPDALGHGKGIAVEAIRLEDIAPAVNRHEWAGAAILAADGLDRVLG